MAVAVLIGLWIWSEVSFNKDNRNYDRVASVMQNLNQNGEMESWDGLPRPLAAVIKGCHRESGTYFACRMIREI